MRTQEMRLIRGGASRRVWWGMNLPPWSAIIPPLPDLPVRSPRTVYHVGDLTGPPKTAHESLEGPGLSVSLHPEEWSEIAGLGGAETWALDAPTNAAGFVDLHALTDLHRVLLRRIAQDAHLVRVGAQWEVRWWDSEIENTCASYWATEAEAVAEAGDEGHELRQITGLFPEPALTAWWARRLTGPIDLTVVEDMAILAILEASGRWAGAWWAEHLDPDAYSAPRGVIFPSQVARWKYRHVTEAPAPEPPKAIGRRRGR